MPKTYTDDAAPTDGDARTTSGDTPPTRVANTGYCRAYGTCTAHYIGSAITARYVNYNSTGGFYLLPIRIPDDMDVAEPCSVKILVNPVFNVTTNGQVIRFYLQQSHVADGGSMNTTSINYDWDVPDNWTTNDYNVVLIDNGNGRTYEAGAFANGDTVGFRIARLGTAAEDTFNKAVKIAEYLQFEYTAKQY